MVAKEDQPWNDASLIDPSRPNQETSGLAEESYQFRRPLLRRRWATLSLIIFLVIVALLLVGYTATKFSAPMTCEQRLR